MNEERTHWTTEDLELYLDGELDAERRAELAAALRRDPALRERYGEVCRLDDDLRAALLAERGEVRGGQRIIRLFSKAAVVAACLMFVVGLTWWYASNESTTDSQSNGAPIADAGTPYESIRVVLSVPVKSRPRDSAVAERVDDTRRIAPAIAERIDAALARGDEAKALSLIADASPSERVDWYRRIGEIIRSAERAESVLNRLSQQDQIAVCKEWAQEPGMRTTAFARLKRLSGNRELAGELRGVVNDLSRTPQLRPWLRTYQLVGPVSMQPEAAG